MFIIESNSINPSDPNFHLGGLGGGGGEGICTLTDGGLGACGGSTTVLFL
jgi:hypothetical protein